jgi:hypothetical protein
MRVRKSFASALLSAGRATAGLVAPPLPDAAKIPPAEQ